MSGFITIALIILVFIIIYQIGKASEYATILRGEEKVNKQVNSMMAWLLVIFFLLGLWGIWECHQYVKGLMLPRAASDHGEAYDQMFLVTIIVTGIVFFITQTLLFWFAFRYQASEKNNKSYFLAHNNRLEILWTTVPAIAMAALVAVGLKNWIKMTSQAPDDAQIVEVVGKQFNWMVRYPGDDGVLGRRDFRMVNDADNIMGLDWSDPDNRDDIISQNGELHLVVNKPVKLIIGSRDVIHNVGLPHFRMKMDAVPGIVTTMWFTPTITSEEMKKITGNPNFVYEIACDQMCGNGHYSMRGTVYVHTQEEFDAWIRKQQSYYTLSGPGAAGADTAEAEASESTENSPESESTEQALTMN